VSDFIFNGKSNDDFDIKVLDIQVDIFAGMKHKILDAPGRAIQHLFPQKPAGRRIVVECIIEKSSLTDLSSKALDIAAWLAQDDWKKLELHTVPGKHFMAVLVEPVDTRQTVHYNVRGASFCLWRHSDNCLRRRYCCSNK